MQATTTIRVSKETHRRLSELAQQLDLPLQEAAARATNLLADELFWQQTRAAYAALRADGDASASFDHELAEWDDTLRDGLEGRA